MTLQKQEFFYKFNKINIWVILNIVMFNVIAYWSIKCPCLLYWRQTKILVGVCIVSWLLWGYKYIKKHRMALVDDKSIQIDSCQPLLWKDIKSAEEKIVHCCFMKRRVIILTPKENIKYHYNWLQKHNCGFGAFSIPLYGILSREDEETLVNIVKSKVKQTMFLQQKQ